MRVGCPLTAQPAGSGGPPLASHHTDSMVEPMMDGRAPKGFNLYARTYSAPGLGVDGSLVSAATCRMHRGTASPGEGQLPPCCRPSEVLQGTRAQPQFCLCPDPDPQQGSRVAAVWGWEQAREARWGQGSQKAGTHPRAARRR